MSDDRADCQRRTIPAGIDVAVLHAVYTMYKCSNCPEKAPLLATFRSARGVVNAAGLAPQVASQSADRY